MYRRNIYVMAVVTLGFMGALCVEEVEEPLVERLPVATPVQTNTMTTPNLNIAAQVEVETANATVTDNLEPEGMDTALTPFEAEARARDLLRLHNVNTIRNALTLYMGEAGSYPEKLESLVPGYLGTMPHDLDDSDFSYTPIGALPPQFYDLCYTLEFGTKEVGAGYHCATPVGIAQP